MAGVTPTWVGDVKFCVFFNQGSAKIQIQDLTYAQHGATDDLIVGMLKIVSPLGIIYQNKNWAADDYSSPDISDDNIEAFKSELDAIDIVDNFTIGTYTFYYKISIDGGVNGYEVSKSYIYNVTAPDTEVLDSFSRETSELTFYDLSDYKLTVIEGNRTHYEYPTSTTKLLTIRPPMNVDALSTITSVTDSVTIGPNCYTGSYYLLLETDAVYVLATWGNYNWINVTFSVENQSTSDLSSVITCFTNYQECITAIDARYQVLVGTNPSKADAYKIIRDNITFYHGLSLIYERAGIDTTYCCTKLMELLRQFDFCSADPSTTPQEIIPTISGSGSGTDGTDGSVWYNGTAIPDATLGDNGDYFLVTTDSKVYYKVAGAWEYRMVLTGSSTARDSQIVQTITRLLTAMNS
jgi:hypothetical protein